jgi:hypothetical protein
MNINCIDRGRNAIVMSGEGTSIAITAELTSIVMRGQGTSIAMLRE